MLDKPTPPQGRMNGDDSATGGNRVSLLNRGNGTAGSTGGNGASGNAPKTSRGLRGWVGVIIGAVVVIALVVIGIVVFTSNDDQPKPGPSPEPTVPAPTSAPASPTPTPTQSADQVAITGATAGYRRWLAVQNRVGQSGGQNASQAELAAVATGAQLTQDRWNADVYYKQRGRKLITPSTIVAVKPKSVGVPNAEGSITDVTLAVCEDVRKAYGVDKSGKSLVSPNRQPYLNDTVALTLTAGSWKVKKFSNQPGRSCA